MVEVASSTLVSRSIFLLFFCLSELFSLGIKDALELKIKEKFPNIQIISLEPLSSNLPAEFNSVELLNLKNDSGSAKIITQNGSLVFTFKFSAKLGVLVATKDIAPNEILSGYELKQIDFLIREKDALATVNKPLVARVKIKNGEILKNRHFRAQNDVAKGDEIVVSVNDGELSAQILAIAMQNGDIGQTIRLKNGHKIIRATIISKNKAIMR